MTVQNTTAAPNVSAAENNGSAPNTAVGIATSFLGRLVSVPQDASSFFKQGFTTVVSSAVGWQTSAIVSAWAPKLILDFAISQQGFIIGGLWTGPALAKSLATPIVCGAGFAGAGATAVTAMGLVALGKAGAAGIEYAGQRLEQRALRNEMRQAQHVDSDEEIDMMAMDDWSELDSPQERREDLKNLLAKETDFIKRMDLTAEISKLDNEIALSNFRTNIA